jgi:membrane protease YdiL (CAAX protease family)
MTTKVNFQSNDQNISRQGPNWPNVGIFLGLTFVLTWGVNLIMWLNKADLGQSAALLLQLQMLLPAFSAILLSFFVFKDSPLYRKNYVTTMQPDADQVEDRPSGGRKVYGPKWFLYAFLIFTLVYAILGMLALARPEQAVMISSIGGGINILMLLILIVIRGISGKQAFDRAGLRGGKPLHWLVYGLAFILFYGLSTALNAAFGLGQPSDPAALLETMSPGQQSIDMPLNVLRSVLFIQMAVVGPLLGLIMGFGEEYGWRSYLQGELIKFGKVRGVLLLGVIWGAWHYPVIWMGHNYPGYPLWGSVVMTGYTILLGFVLGYAMLKTGSIWLVAFLHAINNQAVAFFTVSFYQVENPLFSFGIGVYGLITMLPIVVLLLRDKIWHAEPS